MHLPISNRLAVRTLTVLLLFGALSAFAGSVLAVALNGAGVPLEYLASSPFSSYVVPGLVLGLVVGGTQLAAAIALLSFRGAALLLSAVAGFGMLIWIFVELAVIKQYSWLQSAFFVLGGIELIFVFALLGIFPTLVEHRCDNLATESDVARGRLGMTDAQRLILVRSIHTAIYVVMAISTFVLLYAGVTGSNGAWLWVALELLGVEVVVFFGNGMKCPLTAVAVRYGAVTGHVFDTLLPEQLTRYTFRFFGTVMTIGLFLLAARWLGILR